MKKIIGEAVQTDDQPGEAMYIQASNCSKRGSKYHPIHARSSHVTYTSSATSRMIVAHEPARPRSSLDHNLQLTHTPYHCD